MDLEVEGKVAIVTGAGSGTLLSLNLHPISILSHTISRYKSRIRDSPPLKRLQCGYSRPLSPTRRNPTPHHLQLHFPRFLIPRYPHTPTMSVPLHRCHILGCTHLPLRIHTLPFPSRNRHPRPRRRPLRSPLLQLLQSPRNPPLPRYTPSTPPSPFRANPRRKPIKHHISQSQPLPRLLPYPQRKHYASNPTHANGRRVLDFVQKKRKSSLCGERRGPNRSYGNSAVSREQICDYGVCEECGGLGGVGD